MRLVLRVLTGENPPKFPSPWNLYALDLYQEKFQEIGVIERTHGGLIITLNHKCRSLLAVVVTYVMTFAVTRLLFKNITCVITRGDVQCD